MARLTISLRSTLRAVVADTFLALRNVVRQRRRSALAMAAIVFGIVAMMLAAGFIEWIFWATREGATVNQLGHIQVARPGYFETGHADPFAFLLPKDPPFVADVRTIPEVRSITPRIGFSGLISHGENTLTFLGEGIDPELDPSGRDTVILEGERLSAKDPKGILLGAGLAANLDVHAGDTVVLLAGTRSGGMNAVEARVQGLLSTSLKAYDDAVLRVPIDMARQLLRVSGAQVWVISLRNTDSTETVLAQMQALPSLQSYDVVPWMKLADFYNKTVQLLTRQIDVVKIIIAIIIVLSISNTMTRSVMERTVEIGTAMALGVRRRRIMSLFVLEGAMLGALGGIFGIVLGLLLATILSAVGIPMPPSPGMSRGFTASIIITPLIVWEALLLALATTLLASLYPSWRASRMVIVDALRHNR